MSSLREVSNTINNAKATNNPNKIINNSIEFAPKVFEIAHGQGSGVWKKVVCGYDGLIYFIPLDYNSKVLTYNILTKAVGTIAHGLTSGEFKCGGRQKDGNIKVFPHALYSASKGFVINATSKVLTVDSTATQVYYEKPVILNFDGNLVHTPDVFTINSVEHYVSAFALGPNSKLYHYCYNATSYKIVETDKDFNILNTYNSVELVGGICKGVLASDGCIYFFPSFSTYKVIKFNLATKETTYISFPSADKELVACSLGPDGNIYAFSAGLSNIYKLNVFTGIIKDFSTGINKGLNDVVLGMDGSFYGICTYNFPIFRIVIPGCGSTPWALSNFISY